MIQTEEIFYERNIYLIRFFGGISKKIYSNWFFLHKLVKYDRTCIKLLKSKEISVLAIASMILLPVFAGAIFAQNQALGVDTEKESYAAGETIQITGFVESKLGDEIVTIRIFNPMNNLITIKQVEVNNDGTFSAQINTSIGGQWIKDGTYTIIVNYFSSEQTTAQFQYGGVISAEIKNETPEAPIIKEDDNSESYSESLTLEDYELEYELTGAKIIQIMPDFEMKSLIIQIETYSDGELRITLPKDVIDTDEEGFFVLVDGVETNHEATSNIENWSFIIPFSYGSEEIEIIGTYVIPEFGTVAVLVLIAAIGTIIVISAKNKQIFYPKI